MFFPESRREIYQQNPLKEVICQLRVPSILKITAEIPAAFQDSIRNQYPLYKEESPVAALPKEISDLLAGLPIPQAVQQTPVHKFATIDDSRIISLNQNFLALTERKYQRWDHFRTELQRIEESFRATYSPSFYERIGLRYRNVINREMLGVGNCSWAELLNPVLIGLLGADGIADEVKEIRSQTVVRLPGESAGFVRILHGLVEETGQGPMYVIDSDLFSEERRESAHAFQTLNEFNRLAARFFRWAITDRLRDALRPSPVD